MEKSKFYCSVDLHHEEAVCVEETTQAIVALQVVVPKCVC